MKMQTVFCNLPRRRLPRLALFLALILSIGLIQPALAALVWQIQTVDSAGDVGEWTALRLDSSGNPVISYFDNTHYDLKLVHCGDATCNSNNTIQTIDSAGDVGYYSSLALDSAGRPVISYFDYSGSHLKLARCGNATCSSGNTIQIVDNSYLTAYHSLALDSRDFPVISYVDALNRHLKLAHCGNATCSSDNTIVTVDGTGSFAFDVSLTLDSNGYPVISYFSNGNLRLARCGDATCSSGNTIQTVDSAADVGYYSSLALDNSDRPVISYFDRTNGDLKLARCGDATCSSSNTLQTVDSAGIVGTFTSLQLDSHNKPIISYHDFTNGNLKIVYCGDLICSSGNTLETVDNAADVGWESSLRLDGSGQPVISYHDIGNGDLKLARLVDDRTLPNVTLNQAAAQADPATSSPVLFVASFSEPVTGFTGADVTLNGTVNLASASITVSGGPRDYTISVSGLAGNGTVIATMAAAVATDAAGNPNTASTSTDNSVTFISDNTPPVITASLTPATPNGQNGWYISAVTVSFTCADEAGGSGLATNTVAGATLSTDGANQSVTNTGACSDNAGNVAAPITMSGINLDQTPPTLSPVVSPNPVLLDGVATVSAGATDSVSGLASQSCALPGTHSVGFKSVICTATDNAGNSASASAAYQVFYPWTGFFQPVDNLPIVNTVNAGQAIPVKFSLGGDRGWTIFASGYPAAQKVSCGSGGGGSSDPIEETVTAGNSTLHYDPSTQTYSYIWKTDKAWAGTCRQLIVRLIDGTDHVALFQFNGKVRSADAGEGDESEADRVQQIFLPLVNR